MIFTRFGSERAFMTLRKDFISRLLIFIYAYIVNHSGIVKLVLQNRHGKRICNFCSLLVVKNREQFNDWEDINKPSVIVTVNPGTSQEQQVKNTY